VSSTAATTAPRRPWIVSPAWDLFYLVLTPLLIVPVVLVAARQWLRPEEIYLAVISFASLGHHLPGFMRAYGDRDLFDRFRWRFLLAPPLIFALALVFTPPTSVARALDLPWTHLHGLELILLAWGTWHGLMQTYGFMRIYDIRRGENDRYVARLDHALCLMIFVAGVVFSDTRRSYRLQTLMANLLVAGVPLLDGSAGHRLARENDAFIPAPPGVVGLDGFLYAEILPNLGRIADHVRGSRAAIEVAAGPVLNQLGSEAAPRSAPQNRCCFSSLEELLSLFMIMNQ
jgi:hypothetical protein